MEPSSQLQILGALLTPPPHTCKPNMPCNKGRSDLSGMTKEP